jgi:hypothetical protein
MLVAGFTFIRNAVLYDYPVVEAIRSVLPLCDLLVVAVGRSDDDTLGLVRSIGDARIRIVETVWDDHLRSGGQVLAVETDKAMAAIPPEYDWCVYIQADECLHEQDWPTIRSAMERWLPDRATEGLLFDYRHFYGSYDFVGDSRRWYRREIRIIRNDPNIRSYRDAQGFRYADNGRLRKLRVRQVSACVYHYGWVKPPAAQVRKQLNFNKLWHSDEVAQRMVGDSEHYTYDETEPLVRFDGTHPAVMHPRIAEQHWVFENDPTQIRVDWKTFFLKKIETWTGWRPFEYRNYRLL